MSPLAAPSLGRRAGVLLHPTSLPGALWVGDVGPGARAFARWLAASGARVWQTLPLVPPDEGGSPYSSRSAFAASPLLISLEDLRDDGLLTAEEVEGARAPFAARAAARPEALDRVDLAAARAAHLPLVRRAAARLLERAAAHPARAALDAFVAREAGWLGDAALFEALREAHGGAPWWRWPAPLAAREPKALAHARRAHAAAARLFEATQHLFDAQWARLRREVEALGVRLLGDLPIYVDLDSADVWAHQRLFALDAAGRPTAVAGVPPDAFSATGQLWGNPLYRWDVMAKDGFAWWAARLRRALSLTPEVRVDHFRAFSAYWEVPRGARDAREGRWVEGPGVALFEALAAALGPLPVVAEDLGVVDAPVRALVEAVGCPGMRVLQFAFDGDPRNPYLPHNHAPRAVVYTGTHDNNTTRGWWEALGAEGRAQAQRYLGVSGDDISWDLTRAALASTADLAVVPLQDLLSLGADARMNTPGEAGGSWGWRVRAEALNGEVGGRLRGLCALYGRTPGAGGAS